MTSSTVVRPAARRRTEPLTVSRQLVSAGKLRVTLAVALAAGGAVGGAYLGAQAPVEYTSETRLTVGSTSISSLSVPGYVQAAEQLASTYARYVNTSAIQLDVLADELGVEGDGLVSVQSSPIAESNIVRIQVVATSSSAGVVAADALADELVSVVNGTKNKKQQVRRQLAKASVRAAQTALQVDDAEVALAAAKTVWQREHPVAAAAGVTPSGPAIEAAKTTVAEARSQLSLDEVDLEAATSTFRDQASSDATETGVRVVQPAVVTEDSTSRSTQWGALGGLGIGLAIGGGLLAVSIRRRPRAAD